MLAPPPGGTFDIDNESLLMKSTSTKTDASPEQAPLLLQVEEGGLTSSHASRKWKVRLTRYTDMIFFSFSRDLMN